MREITTEEHIGIAVPDYQCFWHYQHAIISHADSADYVGVTVMNRERFAEMFGDDATNNTLIRLFLTGKPALHQPKYLGWLQ